MSDFIKYDRFVLGYRPSDDQVKGRREGLLRCDNLRLDEEQILSLAPAPNKTAPNPFAGTVHSVYSKYLNGLKHQFVGISTGSVIHSTDGFNSVQDIFINGTGSTYFAKFDDALGQILITSDNTRKKYDGTTFNNLGIAPPNVPPVIATNIASTLDASNADGGGNYDAWAVTEGSNLVGSGIDYAGADSDPNTFRTILQTFYPGGFDTTNFVGGLLGTDQDTFSFDVRIPDTGHLTGVRIEFLLTLGSKFGDGTNTGSKYSDYYSFHWLNDTTSDNITSPFSPGINTWSHLQCVRADFVRTGNDPTLDWSTVAGVRIFFTYDQPEPGSRFTGLLWHGGVAGSLTGYYEYVQVNVNNTGKYLAQSPPGPISDPVLVINGNITLTPDLSNVDSQTTDIWFYRRTSQSVSVDIPPSGLDRFYRTAVMKVDDGSVLDATSDADALTLNLTANLFLLSLYTFGPPGTFLTDQVYGLIGQYLGITLYMSASAIYLSDSLNPDAIDTRYTIILSGGVSEQNCWITKISNGILLLGTTKDIYEITGTLRPLPDGTMDILIKSVGENHPPISRDFWLDSGAVFYVANDGVRITNGSVSQLISPELNLLFKGEARYGIQPVAIYPNEQDFYPVCVNKGRLFCALPLKDGTRPLFIYDLLKQNWTFRSSGPNCLFTEEDGNLIGGYGNQGGVLTDCYLRNMEAGFVTDGVTAQNIYIQTIFDDKELPRNRKDLFTYKLICDSGGNPIDIYIAKDENSFIKLGTYTCNANVPVLIDLSQVAFSDGLTLGFRLALRIIGQVNSFRLYEQFIEFEARPEQLNFLRILPNNLGTASRKRIVNYPFIIDTLGNDVTFTPIADTATFGSASTVNTPTKQTYIHYFKSELITTDISGTLESPSGSPFEYYGLNLEEIVSEKLPVPVKYLIIPPSDYGIPNRKRHSSYKFSILSRGKRVQFTPIIDGVSYPTAIYNTSTKTTVEYYFTSDTIGIDIGGILQTLDNTPFEFYGVITPQKIEQLPDRLTYFRIPESNFGAPAKKRTRTLPMQINTNGQNVVFNPIVDQTNLSGSQQSVFNTPSRQTVLHYFTTDQFGIDYSGELIAQTSTPFEFYGLEQPEDVEILPVGKKFDQLGPLDLDRMGKVIGFRVRLVATDTSLPWIIYFQDAAQQNGIITTVPNIEDRYDVEWISKSRTGRILRFELGPCGVFYRYYVEFKVNFGGKEGETNIKWIRGSQDINMRRMRVQ